MYSGMDRTPLPHSATKEQLPFLSAYGLMCWFDSRMPEECGHDEEYDENDEENYSLFGHAFQRGPPPLHQPGAACRTRDTPVEHFSANGKLSLNCLSHPRGQAQIHCTSICVFNSGKHWQTKDHVYKLFPEVAVRVVEKLLFSPPLVE